MTISYPRRGELWRVQFNPTRGDEIQKARPVVVISADENKEMVVVSYDRSNNNDDVSFVSGAVRKIVSDQNKIKSLLRLGILYIISPSIFDSISPPLSAVIRAILLLPMLRQVDPFINLVAAILTKFKA